MNTDTQPEILNSSIVSPILRLHVQTRRKVDFVEMSPAEEKIRSVWLTLQEPSENLTGMSPAKFSALCTKFSIDSRASARLSSNGYVWTDGLNRYWRGDGTRRRTGDGTGKVARLTEAWAAEEVATAASTDVVAPSLSELAEELPDGRYRRPGLITVRLGQDKFRSALLDLYGHKCWISECSVEEVLQAAHVEPHNGSNNRVSNGMLLRADLHNLYDAGLMWVEPIAEDYRVRLSPVLGNAYSEFADRQLDPPNESRDKCPDRRELLRQRPDWSRQ